jgi:kumamolisin
MSNGEWLMGNCSDPHGQHLKLMSELATLTLIFHENEPARLQSLAEQISDPLCAGYGQHLDRDELAALVALPDSERRQVSEWLGSRGMTVIDTPETNKQLMFVRATSEQIEAAFGHEMISWLKKSGDTRAARMPLALPRRLAGYVQKVSGLIDERRATGQLLPVTGSLDSSARVTRELPREIPSGAAGFTPADIREIYQFPNEWDGSGETIALMALGGELRTADLLTFWNSHGLNAGRMVVKQVGATKSGKGDPVLSLETTMIVEWAGAMAPGAQIVVYHIDPAATSDPWSAFLLAVIGDKTHTPTIACTSWITPERRYYGMHGHSVISGLLNQCAALGITVISAAGDWGAFDGIPRHVKDGRYVSDAPWPHGVFPAVEERVLAVGGTMITGRNPLTEVAWSGPPPPGMQKTIHFEKLAGSGGFSEDVPIPAWQQPVLRGHYSRGPGRPAVVPYGRGFPDVALMAAGPSIQRQPGEALTSQSYQAVVGGRWIDYAGGTSVAAPIWAAIIARANQARRKAGLGRVGFINPLLYQFDNAKPSPFRQITVGSADVAMTVVNRHGQAVTYDLPGYECRAGWNPVTGLGVPHVANLIDQLRRKQK